MYEMRSARALADAADAGEAFTLIDTRPAESFENWHIASAHNIPFGLDDTLTESQRSEIDSLTDGREILTICGKGATSAAFAAELDTAGYDDVAVVSGGMRDWNELYERARLETDDDDLLLMQFQRRAKGCLSYLVGARSAGEAVVVDPSRHTDQYVRAAAENDLKITHVLDTHVHADHISGGHAFATALEVPYYLGEKAADRGVEYEFVPLRDGDTLSIGTVDLEVVPAPGHTSELVACQIGEEAVLTGDALFLDAVGRTELEFGDSDARTGAKMQYETLHETLVALPEELIVLPAHVSITADGQYTHAEAGELVGAPLATVQSQLDLVGLDESAFLERLVDSRPEKPANYETITAINRGLEPIDSSRGARKLETGANNCAG